jgi:hypothetical protein
MCDNNYLNFLLIRYRKVANDFCVTAMKSVLEGSESYIDSISLSNCFMCSLIDVVTEEVVDDCDSFSFILFDGGSFDSSATIELSKSTATSAHNRLC